MTQPEFVDNRHGNTLALALTQRIEHLADTLKGPVSLAVATGYFNPEGFGVLAGALDRLGSMRLLIGAEPIPPAVRRPRRLDEPRGERFEHKLMQEALEQNERALLRDRDRLPFDPGTDRAIRQLLAYLETGRLKVRRYTKRFLHGKAYLFSSAAAGAEGGEAGTTTGHGVLAGSSNFTAAGLLANLELNLGQYQPSVVQHVEQWYEDLWAEADDYDLAAIYAARFQEYEPYLIYLRILLERYGEELDQEVAESGRIHLTRFQTDGLDRARRILERYNGVLIADGVGLGKTFLAGELLRDVIERNRQRALLIAPAALRDGTWSRFRARFQLGVEVRSFEQVTEDVQLGGDRTVLSASVDDYALIVIDEAHAYRSLETRRAAALRRLLRGDPPKRVVLMTATPVNNSLWDLYDLLSYFVGHDAVFADSGIPSLKKRFDLAAAEDPFTLKPDLLFDVLDATTVRRTRHFVKKFYASDTVDRGDGTRVTIQFPTPHVASCTYDLDAVLPGFFDEFTELLAPEDGQPQLSMARYAPTAYRRHGQAMAREAALVGLVRSGLLKRFESSAYAFCRTLDTMVVAHEHFLDGLEEGRLLDAEALGALAESDGEDRWDDLLGAADRVDPKEIDVPRLTAAVRRDRDILASLRDRARHITQKNDPKLKLIAQQLGQIVRAAERDGVTPEDQRNRRKVLIFSYFADTVDWIVEFLRDEVERNRALHAYRGRIAAVRGNESWEGITREKAVFGFAPESSEAPPGDREDKYDILVTTDVLAEGMNLQQAARIINVDLPWNPMRLVQRHGRVDRIGSPHRDVYITCVFPDRHLERLLTIEDRIRRKLAQAAASIGLETAPIPGVDVSDHVFTDSQEARAELEKLRRGDASLFETAGERGHAHSGEEYRQELRKGLERYGDSVRTLPGGAGSGVRRGRRRGHVFCAKIGDKAFLRFVPLGGTDDDIVRDSLSCLGLITCREDTERVLPDDLKEAAYDAWARARADIWREWQQGVDPANLQPSIRPLFRRAAEQVRRFPPPEMTLEEIDRLTETLEAPWGMRIERSLRAVFPADAAAMPATSRRIVDWVREYGLQPWKAPEPLPPVDESEILLTVWMGIEAEASVT
jgi:hypothetical protein